MTRTRSAGFVAILVAAATISTVHLLGQRAPAAPSWSDSEIERFLATAREVGRGHPTRKGVTGAIRVTLTDGTHTHDAQVQKIDETRSQFETARGVELNFRDSWKYNVAAYRVDRLLGMMMVPVSIQRQWGRDQAAVTWWVDDVLMDEGERVDKKLTAPDLERWNQQVQLVRVLDQLIANVDRNAGNLLITRDWRVWAIDHTRSFRLNKSLKAPKNVTRCDRVVFERLKALDRATMDKAVGSLLTGYEIQALLARRDAIVGILEAAGPAAIFDR